MFTRQLLGSLILVFGFGTLVSVGFQSGRLDRIPDSELDSIHGALVACAPIANAEKGARCAGASSGTNSCVMAMGSVVCADLTFKCPLDCPQLITVFPFPIGGTVNAMPLTNCPNGNQAQCIASADIMRPCKCGTLPANIMSKPCAETYRPVCGT